MDLYDILKYKTFSGYDVNGDGKVSVAEFKRIMLRSGIIYH